MFIGIAVLLVILWGLGFITFHVAGAFIHILLVLAVISFIVHFLTGKPVA